MEDLHLTAPTKPLDLAAIEAEAHRLRAETLRAGLRALVTRLVATVQGLRAGNPHSA